MARRSAAGRDVLPIPDAHQPYPGLVTYDAKDPATSFAPIEQLRPPAGAPNVLVILLDDNRGIYHQGWTAVTRHSTPWVIVPLPEIDNDVWELYGPDDWTQARNLADDNPAKPAELQRLFLIEATSTTCSPSTTDASSVSTRTWPGGHSSSRATPSCSSAAWGASPRTPS